MNHTRDESRPLEGARILLAEAGPDNQRLFCSLLSSAGAEVVVAESGSRVIEHFRAAHVGSSEFALVLMDMQLPGLGGDGATQRLRELGARLPIVALTAHALDGEHERCLEAGCDESLVKPVEHEELIATCVRWFEASLRAASSSQGGVTPHAVGGSDSASRSASSPRSLEPESAGQGDRKVLRSPMSDDPDLVEILRMFLSNLEPKLDQLVELMEAEERDGLAKLAHKLKGTGGSYGFPTISAAARAVEHEVREQGDSEDLRRAVGELTDICRAAIRSEQPAA